MTALLVVVGAMVGAPLRYMIDQVIQSRHPMAFPAGTLVVNALGSLILGVVAAATLHGPDWAVSLAGTGFCGALTTFSTFSFETVRLIELGRIGLALSNVLACVTVGLTACAAGFALASKLVG